ncbi:hypothetical protein [Corynebacterium uterequi]|uniref:hypothetical protein n=1 Tax=Corynebacterium uterequi TaxID=1072256 RepID=UPI000AC0CFAA|nr:hypothetical protein [Corynebacterium uterequi]
MTRNHRRARRRPLPLSFTTRGLGEPEKRDALQRERALLYVASSRARESLVVTSSPESSELSTS